MADITRLQKGLNRDKSENDQPKSTYRFALNAVSEAESGGQGFISNEKGNVAAIGLTAGYTPIGSVYVSDNETVLFSVSSDESMSEIGIIGSDSVYRVLVNADLKFKASKQIQAIYRLRRGCEKTVYWVDGDNQKPRYFILSRAEKFKTSGAFDSSKFELQRSYSDIPSFRTIEVLNSGGQLKSGSYNFAIQYLDESLNQTEWITSSSPVNVFVDDTTKSFLEVNGSMVSEDDYLNFPVSDKAIKVVIDNIDSTFLFYRLAVIEAVGGTGDVTRVLYTDKLPTTQDSFTYTGLNHAEVGTTEELLLFSDIIESAHCIEQLESRLILGNTQGKDINFCKLQRYASKIKADAVVQDVIANVITGANAKNPSTQMNGGGGYQSGEIYSFAIVYVFKDGTLSPAYPIPGKNPNVLNNEVYLTGDNIVGMSNDNSSASSVYTDNGSGGNMSAWGLDSEGEELVGKPVRHHRFPERDLVPLVTSEVNAQNNTPYYVLRLKAEGTITLPVTCTQEEIDAETCTPVVAENFHITVYYSVGSTSKKMTLRIDPSKHTSASITEYLDSERALTDTVVIDRIEEQYSDAASVVVVEGVTSPKGLVFTTEILTSGFDTTEKTHTVKQYAIQFSGISLPSTDVLGERYEIVGYYIVRQEREEKDKTVLDTAVLTPTLVNDKYTSTGLLCPDTDYTKVNKSVYNMIHPQHKFNDRKYENITKIKLQGLFEVQATKLGTCRFRGVSDGTTHTSNHEGSDDDGFSLKAVTRDNILRYSELPEEDKTEILSEDIERIAYLNALENLSPLHKVGVDDELQIYNNSADNKTGIIEFTNPLPELPDVSTLRYVTLYRDIANPYADFKTAEFHKVSDSMQTEAFTTVNGGDTYVSPMRYTSSVFWDIRNAARATEGGLGKILVGALVAVAGVVLAVFTLGLTAPIAIAAGLIIAGGGAMYAASGIRQEVWARTYQEEYDKGLRETVLDTLVDQEYNYVRYGVDGPEDDEIQWVAECLTDLWFESSVNIAVRNKMMSSVTPFLDAPGIVENSDNSDEPTGSEDGRDWLNITGSEVSFVKDLTRHPTTLFQKHVMDKLLAYDPTEKEDGTSERVDGRKYLGHPLGEYYNVNKDYHRINNQKVFFCLPLEYDCCSECGEKFPHRVRFTEQSFQEELQDNFRVFLPNNYKDLEGETGSIQDFFRVGNSLFIHTKEALWHLPQSVQERVTNEIVSFIGTGEFFSMPPRKIGEGELYYGGTTHSVGTLKTKHGVFFISESERKIYQFNGQKLKPISDYGLSNWFTDNAKISFLEEYRAKNTLQYPYDNNPSNEFGVGFTSFYDQQLERVVFTKHDKTANAAIPANGDFQVCSKGSVTTVFEDYQQKIDDKIALGWNYIGIEDCRMKFEKTEITTVVEQRVRKLKITNETDIHVWSDNSGSFGVVGEPIPEKQCFQRVVDAVDEWVANYSSENPDWVGRLFKYESHTDEFGNGGGNEEPFEPQAERWLSMGDVRNTYRILGENIADRDILYITFGNESSGRAGTYQSEDESVMTMDNLNYPTAMSHGATNYWFADLADFQSLQTAAKSFKGIAYPIVFGLRGTEWDDFCGGPGSGANGDLKTTRFNLMHSIACIHGINFTAGDKTTLLPVVNPGLTQLEWDTMLTSLETNPYTGVNLSSLGWSGKFDRAINEDGTVIDSVQFGEDIDEILQGSSEEQVIDVTINVETTTTSYIDGDPIELFDKDNSWSISYCLKTNSWVSWHSYIPDFSYSIPMKVLSWIKGNDNLWEHNKGAYQTYYGNFKPHIVEYVQMSEPIKTKIWDDIVLHTEARKNNTATDSFVDLKQTTYNKAVFYNTRQCSGELTLNPKADAADYLFKSIVTVDPMTVVLDRNEKSWCVNHIRDIRVDYSLPIFKEDVDSLSSTYFIDKILNTDSLNSAKHWSQLEPFKDKFLVVRLIFDNFDDVNIILNYTETKEREHV